MPSILYEKLLDHFGHDIVIASYADGLNLAIECEECNEVIISEDLEPEQEEE